MTAPPQPPARTPPGFGQYLPMFRAASDGHPQFSISGLGGVWMVLMFFGSLRAPGAQAAHDAIVARRSLFDDRNAYFFGLSVDPADRESRGLKDTLPGLRYFWDFDAAVSRGYGVADQGVYLPQVFLADRALR